MKRKILRALYLMLLACAICVTGIVVCDTMVTLDASGRAYDSKELLPHRSRGLVLGTSPISIWTGRRNLYFDERIRAAADLYLSGKVDTLVLSGGDYRAEGGYDEPVAMRDSLIKAGVDPHVLILDYDGTRTLASIAKIKQAYPGDSIVIISQRYHNERALFQAKHLGVNAIAYDARTSKGRAAWLRNRGRECLSRVKLFMDLYCGEAPQEFGDMIYADS